MFNLSNNTFEATTSNNSDYDESNEIGTLKYFIANIDIYLPSSIFSGLGVIVGVIGNSLIIGAILSIKELRMNPTFILILNLSFADAFISVIVDSFTVVGCLIGKSLFSQYIWLCKLVASVCMVACATSLVTMGFLALNRYISIFYHHIYNRAFTIPKTIIYCCLTWTVGLIANFPNIVGK
jgi:hypothetical protein